MNTSELQEIQALAPVLQARGLHKSYGSKPALKGLNLEIFRGQFVALLGPNGAGKSTLIQLLSGLFVPDAGDLSLLGFDLRNQAPRALAGLGVVFQQSSLDLDLSVQANLLFHTDLHGIPRKLAHQRIEQGLAQHGLQAQEIVKYLSGGNRRKVELVRAMLHQPAFLLMDEATVGLDTASRHALLRSVYALTRSGQVAVLWTTHLVEEVADADQLIILNQGHSVFQGTPAALVEQSGGLGLESAFLRLCQNIRMA